MNSDVPRLVATVPARSVNEARTQTEEAHRAGADIVELRLDRWPVAERDRVAELFPLPLPVLATLRSRIEGGEGPDDPTERRSILTRLAGYPFSWIDLERARDSPRGILGGARPEPGTIRSTHFPDGTGVAELLAVLGEPVSPGSIQKLVLPMPMGVAIRELIPALEGDRLSPGRTVLTTGGSGPLLRALGKRLRLTLVYGSLPRTLARDGAPSVEPTQIPVDRLRRYFSDDGEPPLFAVVGHPIDRSLSPTIHHRWFAATDRVGLYLPLDIASDEEFRAVLPGLGELGFRGLNVTHPWKEEALRVARSSTPLARECGAANCLTFTEREWKADNTDVLAVRRRMEELRTEGSWDGAHVTVLGAGGAARATLVAARNLGARTQVLARRRGMALEIAHEFGGEVADPTRPMRDTLVVHATSAGGASGDVVTLPVREFLAPGSTLLDWGYRPLDDHLARIARDSGARYEGGERLLVYQAASSFARWWGAPPPAEAVATVLAEVGCTA